MPFAIGGNARIRTNTPAENAYNSLEVSNRDISLRQLRLSTGKRINNAADDVAGYITSRALQARNGSLKSALLTVGDAQNSANILMDSLDGINELLSKIKDATSQAASGALGTDEKVALAKAAYRLTQQIQTLVDSTVFGGAQLLGGSFTSNFIIGLDSKNTLLTLGIDMSTNNIDFNVEGNNFNVNALNTDNFGSIADFNLASLNLVTSTDLGIFSTTQIGTTLTSLSKSIDNVNKVASYLGGISNRLSSQEDLLKNQIVNYNAAISRIEDADVAKEQLQLIKSQFLQQASLTSLTQANQNPSTFLQLIRG
ncbi:MAG TPA: flagellin [Candidatus Kapabacteria bacterium]|nr:flagellin [Candidatus Kapabacteria bacterium]